MKFSSELFGLKHNFEALDLNIVNRASFTLLSKKKMRVSEGGGVLGRHGARCSKLSLPRFSLINFRQTEFNYLFFIGSWRRRAGERLLRKITHLCSTNYSLFAGIRLNRELGWRWWMAGDNGSTMAQIDTNEWRFALAADSSWRISPFALYPMTPYRNSSTLGWK